MTQPPDRVDTADWSALVYAATPGKAKQAVLVEYLWDEPGSYTDLRAVRVPACDRFADGSVNIDDDLTHQLMAGMVAECSHCDRRIESGDAYEIVEPYIILCTECAAEGSAA